MSAPESLSTADQKEWEALAAEQYGLQHAIQSGVLYEHDVRGSHDGTPKHLRVGVNMALCQVASLTRLLVDKGICTELEALRYNVDELRRELDRYQARNPGVRFS